MKSIFKWAGQRLPTDHTHPHLPHVELFEHDDGLRMQTRDATGFVVGVDLNVTARIELSRALIGKKPISALPADERIAYAQALLEGTDAGVAQLKPGDQIHVQRGLHSGKDKFSK